MAYGIDFVKKAVAYKDAGRTFKQLREVFGIPPETFYRWKERLKNGCYEAPKAGKERPRKIDGEKLKRGGTGKPRFVPLRAGGTVRLHAASGFLYAAKPAHDP